MGDMADESKKRYEMEMAAYKEGTYVPPSQDDKEKTTAPAEIDITPSKKNKKKKDKKRQRSPSPDLAQPSTDNSPNTSPAKKKARKVSFETSTPIRLEENDQIENNNDVSINDEIKKLNLEKTEKKKSKKKKKDKDKDKQDLTPMQNHLLSNMM